jgi:hypothetical protein
VPHGEHEAGPDEQVNLAEVHFLDIVEVASGAQHGEQGVVVALQLGPLMSDDRILNRELM